MKKHLPTTVSIAIITTITIFAWIFFEVYRILTTKPEINIDPIILGTINPNLDKESLEKIKSGLSYSNDELNTVIQLPSPTPEISSIPTETPSPTPTTESAQIIEP